MEPLAWWSSRHIELAEEVWKFAEEAAPTAIEAMWEGRFPSELLEEVKKRGWFGAMIPEEYGGLGLGYTGAIIVAEGLSRIPGPLVHTYSVTMFGGTNQVLKFGSEELKSKVLPRVAKGWVGAIVITEPYAGSDAAAIETRAEKTDRGYVLWGRKRYITNTGLADMHCVYARTSWKPEDVASRRHLTCFIVESTSRGLKVERLNPLMGWDYLYNGYIVFDGVEVPEENRVGEEGEGWKVMMAGLDFERLIFAAEMLGPMWEAIRYAAGHAKRRVQFNRPVIEFESNRFKIADAISKYRMARLTIYYGAHLLDRGEEAGLEGNIGKLYASEWMGEITRDMIQVMGGNGFTKLYPVEAWFRDSKVAEIGAGTSEVIRIVIFRQAMRRFEAALRLPRRKLHPELKVPVPLKPGEELPKLPATEEGVLKALTEAYIVDPGLSVEVDELVARVGSREEAERLLLKLKEKGLAEVYRDRKGRLSLARPTLKALEKLPLEEVRWYPRWASPESLRYW